MMRFILDCLRAGRRRAASERENSLELQTKDKEAADNEIKVLEDVVAMEEGALQKERVLSQDAQQALERLTKRRSQLKEEIEGIQEQRKQEGQLLLSLQEEQEELEQMVQEYELELERATDELRHLHEEVGKTRASVEDAHSQMGSLKHSIGETYTEITETKERLGELIAEMIAIEACVPEITYHQVDDPLSIDLDNSSREDPEDEHECYGHGYKDENIKKNTVEKYHSELEQNTSAENLKSSGSSSFTEITLTEVKEEDTSPRSNTPQHTDSPDLEDEDFEIVQSLDTKPMGQVANREFDFFHPDPFVDHDVFGDERFPKLDMTEFLSGDPFKGTDPFASDVLFNDVVDAQVSQDCLHSENSNTKGSDPLSFGPEFTSKDGHTSNAVVRSSANVDCQSIDSGMFEQNIPEPSDSERYTPYSDIYPDVGNNTTASQELDSSDLNNTSRTEFDLPASSQLADGGRFDPIHCEHNDSHESDSSDSSTVDSSFDGDFGTFTEMEHQEHELQAEAGPSYVRRNQALYGLQRIDTSSYTNFPLSPDDAYAPVQDVTVASDKSKPIEVADPFSFHSDHDAVSELNPEGEKTLPPQIQPGNPSPLSQEFEESCDYDQANHAAYSPESSETDAYDHKFGDIYFFTVRLDPGSPDASPASNEVSNRKKSECDHTSPESNDSDEFGCDGPEDEDLNQFSPEAYLEESFDKDECRVIAEEPLRPEPNEPEQSESEISPIGDIPNAEHEDQGDAFDVFDHSSLNLIGNSLLKYTPYNTHNEIPRIVGPENEILEIFDPKNEISANIDLENEYSGNTDLENEIPETFYCEHEIPENIDLDNEFSGNTDLENEIPETFDCEHEIPENIDLDNEFSENSDPENETVENIDPENEVPQNVHPAYTEDNSENFITQPVGQYLISPVSDDSVKVTTDSSKLFAHNPFSLDSGSIDHCDNFKSNLEPFNSENYIIKKSNECDTELKALDPFDSVLLGNKTRKSEVNHPTSGNSICTESGRLDSGYHENSSLDPFGPVPSHPSTDMCPCFVSSNTDMLNPGLFDLEAPDPFSPESNGTLRFHSELFNPSTDDGVMKDSCHVYTASSDVLGDSFSGSEFDSFDPFSPVPYLTGGSFTQCNVDILVPGLIQNSSKGDEDTRSSSCDSGVSQSPQLHCSSTQNKEVCHPPVNSEDHTLGYLANFSTKDSFFESNSSNITDADALKSKVEKITEQDNNSSMNNTAMAELNEIDIFCSELSKMVASRSSDSVQQSVAEMLFGSNPDTAKFYPWDFENSNAVVNESSSPEVDFDESYNFSKDLPKLEAVTRSHRSSDLLGELQSAAGLTLDEAEKHCLL